MGRLPLKVTMDPRYAAKPTQPDTPIEVILTSQSVGIRSRYSFLPGTKLGVVKKQALKELGFAQQDWTPVDHWTMTLEERATPQEMQTKGSLSDDTTLDDIGANLGTEFRLWYTPPK